MILDEDRYEECERLMYFYFASTPGFWKDKKKYDVDFAQCA
jgi:hypothetical protein